MVSSIGNSVASLMQRPDPSQMASKLFSRLDSKNQGYIEKSDLQSAFDQISGSSSSGSSVDDVFSQLDNDGDGKVTKQEMSDSLAKMAEQLDSQFNNLRMGGMGGMGRMGGMNGEGLTKDQLTSMADETSAASSRLTNLVANFDEADTNGDGKVSAQEAMTFSQASQQNATTSTSSASANGSGASGNSEAGVMMKIMQLVHAYGGLGQESEQSGIAGSLSVSA